jgi:hypothetical protein
MAAVRSWISITVLLTCVSLTGAALMMSLGATGRVTAATQVAGTILLLFPAAGVLLVRRSPKHVFGWLFLALGLATSLDRATAAFIETRVLQEGTSGLVADLATWTNLWTSTIGFALVPVMLLLFPTGRPASPRWRPVVTFAVVAVVMMSVSPALAPQNLGAYPRLDNPYGIEGATFFETTLLVGWFAVLASIAAGALALIARFRRGSADEREQLKWVLLAAALLVGSTFTWGISEELGTLTTAIAMASLPIAVTVAILKYRLYDIDLVINRALVYGSLTAILAALYAGIVSALSVSVGGSDLSVAAATLVVAGVFRPLRRVLQDFIDRRFYRRKFDAQRTVERFSARLRESIDLPTMTRELTSVVDQTVHPVSVSVWLLTESQGQRDQAGSATAIG